MAEKKYQIKIEAAVEGQAKIRALADEVKALGSEAGTNAAIQARKLADELDRLGQEHAAVGKFRALSEAVKESAERQAALREQSAALKPTLDNVGNTVRNLGRAYNETETQVQQLADEQARETATLATLRGEVRQSAKAKAALRDRTRELKQAIKETGDPAGELKRELAGVSRETGELTKKQQTARAEIKRLAEQTKQTGAAKKELSGHLREVSQSLKTTDKQAKALGRAYGKLRTETQQVAGAEKEHAKQLDATGKEMDSLGISTKNLATTEKALSANIEGATRDIERFKTELKQVKGGLNQTGAAGQKAGRQIRQGMEDAGNGATGLRAKLASLRSAGGGVLALIASVVALAKGFLGATKAAEGLQKGFELISGSSEAARQDLDFVRSTANRLGQDVATTGKAFLELTAASKGTALEGQATRDIFTAISTAMGRLGKSSADTEGALLAVQQMISKGKVSAEELRGQLGERLPGAFQAAARAIGVTTEELGKMLESGNLVAEDLLPKLATELNKTFDTGEKVNTLSSAWNRFTNSLNLFATSADKASGITGVLATGLEKVTFLVNLVATGFTIVVEKIKATSTAFGLFMDFVSGELKFTEFKEQSTAAFKAAGDAIVDTADRAFGLEKAITTTGNAGKKAGEKIAEGMRVADKATDAQNKTFGDLVLQTGKAVSGEFNDLQQKIVELKAAGELTDDQFLVLNKTLAAQRDAAQDSAAAFNKLTGTIQVAGSATDLMQAVDDLSEGLRTGVITQDEYKNGLKQVGEQTDKVTGITKRGTEEFKKSTKATGEATEAQEANTEAVSSGGSAMAVMAAHMNSLRKEMSSLSEGALVLFDSVISEAGGSLTRMFDATERLVKGMPRMGTESEKLSAEIKDVERDIKSLNAALREGRTATGQWFIQTELAGKHVKKAYLEAKQSAAGMVDQLEELDLASQSTLVVAQGMVDGFSILNDQDLSKLRGEVDRLNRATEQAADSAASALKRYQDLVDRQAGNDLAIAQREQAEVLKDLETQIAAARKAGNKEAIRDLEQALGLARKYHSEEIAALRAELEGEKEITNERNQRSTPKNGGTVPATPNTPVPPGARNYRGNVTPRPAVNNPNPATSGPYPAGQARVDPADMDAMSDKLKDALGPLIGGMQTMTQQIATSEKSRASDVNIAMHQPDGTTLHGSFSEDDAERFLDLLSAAKMTAQ